MNNLVECEYSNFYVKLPVILSNAIIYNNHNVDITPRKENEIKEDLKLLKRELFKKFPSKFSRLTVNNSLLKDGVSI